ncbi:hypothetical protein EVAR_43987_1 [Eumeta japonica]|uniref:Uncharacterized protein n=1 Tax=Eumeta variegata TaxID=151549 RepID=A0A4C1XH36_EUMVA|nr:hypothetical protein EVAR_43987_1 [Eumeta japonica]
MLVPLLIPFPVTLLNLIPSPYSYSTHFGPGLAFDSDPGFFVDFELCPAFNFDSSTRHSSDFDETEGTSRCTSNPARRAGGAARCVGGTSSTSAPPARTCPTGSAEAPSHYKSVGIAFEEVQRRDRFALSVGARRAVAGAAGGRRAVARPRAESVGSSKVTNPPPRAAPSPRLVRMRPLSWARSFIIFNQTLGWLSNGASAFSIRLIKTLVSAPFINLECIRTSSTITCRGPEWRERQQLNICLYTLLEMHKK